MSRTLAELLRDAHAADIELRATATGLKIAARLFTNPELLLELRERRDEVAAELRAHSRPGRAPVVHLHGGGR
jgi:hypothetical protein